MSDWFGRGGIVDVKARQVHQEENGAKGLSCTVHVTDQRGIVTVSAVIVRANASNVIQVVTGNALPARNDRDRSTSANKTLER